MFKKLVRFELTRARAAKLDTLRNDSSILQKDTVQRNVLLLGCEACLIVQG